MPETLEVPEEELRSLEKACEDLSDTLSSLSNDAELFSPDWGDREMLSAFESFKFGLPERFLHHAEWLNHISTAIDDFLSDIEHIDSGLENDFRNLMNRLNQGFH